MPTSVTGSNKKRRSGGTWRPRIKAMGRKGFTLIEMLVVLAIIGITAGIIGVNLAASDSSRLHHVADRLASQLEAVHDKAMDEEQTTGWSIARGMPGLWRYDADRAWQPLAGASGDRWQMPADVQVAGITINQHPAAPGDKLVFSPTGINLPFELTLVSGAGRLLLRGDAVGHVQVDRP